MSLITIIIPTYNSGVTVRVALESVLRQTFQNWECIVVDGVSKDDTIAIVKEYCNKDSRFRYISEKDHGIYDAFNKGWKMAQSPWVHYLGSDDTLTVDGMSGVAAELDETHSIVTGDVYLYRVDGTVREQQYNGYFGCHQGVVMQRKAIDALGGFDEQYRILADYDLLVRAKKSGYRVKNVRVHLANFNLQGESQQLKTHFYSSIEYYKIDKKNQNRHFPLLHIIWQFFSIGLSKVLRLFLSKIKKRCLHHN